jgi:hypothetical protein
MDRLQENCFVVFLRNEAPSQEDPETVEQEVAECASYEDARRIRGEYLAHSRDCVVRYVGPSGGGD